MTGKDFAKLCYEEKKSILNSYFANEAQSAVSLIINRLIASGASKEELYKLVDTVMTDSFYTLLLGLDGACSLGNEQVTYKLYDEDGNFLNPCGEIEENAYNYFIEE